jgi:beta-glucuronidase
VLIGVTFCFGLSSKANNSKVYARDTLSLNGKWQIIVDPFDRGLTGAFWKNAKQNSPKDIIEYGFTDKNTLNVPGDWNSQQAELTYYEGTVWYKKNFDVKKVAGKRTFIKFGAAANVADVYLNGKKLGSHEGGFTPFEFDVTNDLAANGQNTVVVRVNNKRHVDAIPAMAFDWWNYGGITRDVAVLFVPENFIGDYFVQLKKGTFNQVEGWVKLNNVNTTTVSLQINGEKVVAGQTDSKGIYKFGFKKSLRLWSTDDPYLYDVKIKSDSDSLNELIGFRNIEVKGKEILLNGQPVFLKGVNIHEEVPQRMARAYTDADATMLINWAKDLGCNFIRLAHYPHNEYITRLAEKSGLMIWEEIPLWQGISFSDPVVLTKARTMLKDMIQRDKNRCGVVIWSLSNETNPAPDRNEVLKNMAGFARELDDTRLISSAIHRFKEGNGNIHIEDPICSFLDIIAVNKYLGWYTKWPGAAGDVTWTSDFNKPVIVSEFGGEALYGHNGSEDAIDWSEQSQAKIYEDNITMFKKMDLLRGICPWLLVDFRSPHRLKPDLQDGWNRKGLLSDKGYKKKAWYLVRDFYDSKTAPKASKNASK